MPKYIATLAFNVRHYSKWKFSAASDEKAANYLRECQERGSIPWDKSDEGDDADALEPILMLDRCKPNSGERDAIIEEERLPAYLYYKDAEAFVRKVAALVEEGAYTDAIETLGTLIRQAQALTAKS